MSFTRAKSQQRGFRQIRMILLPVTMVEEYRAHHRGSRSEAPGGRPSQWTFARRRISIKTATVRAALPDSKPRPGVKKMSNRFTRHECDRYLRAKSWLCALAALFLVTVTVQAQIDYRRDIRPIL